SCSRPESGKCEKSWRPLIYLRLTPIDGYPYPNPESRKVGKDVMVLTNCVKMFRKFCHPRVGVKEQINTDRNGMIILRNLSDGKSRLISIYRMNGYAPMSCNPRHMGKIQINELSILWEAPK
ncbi:MAG: hypothetical protein KC643_23250, partial [Nitrospira sp.]|nr:hypothetical protein [Nitrospira sp.]